MTRHGTCEVFHVTLEEQTKDTVYWNADDDAPVGAGWFYWCCMPGCLPEGDPIGPFETEEAAYDDAVSNDYITERTEVSEAELDQRYRAMLDEVHGTVKVAGYEYDTSRALLELDPTAYRCGFADWLDSECSDGRLVQENDTYYEGDQ